MEVTVWTYMGIIASAYWFVFKFIPWVEGDKR